SPSRAFFWFDLGSIGSTGGDLFGQGDRRTPGSGDLSRRTSKISRHPPPGGLPPSSSSASTSRAIVDHCPRLFLYILHRQGDVMKPGPHHLDAQVYGSPLPHTGKLCPRSRLYPCAIRASDLKSCVTQARFSDRVGQEEYPMPIEQFAPELEKIISLSEPIQMLADGFGGPQGPAEGPVWWKEGSYLLFSDIHNNRRMKYMPGQGVSLVHEP